MTNSPLVSILMPTNSAPDQITGALQSSLDQTYPNIEIVAVVDRETTETEEQHYSSRWPSVVFVFMRSANGITKALNEGLKHVRGEFVFRLDDDDLCRADRIQLQMNLMESEDLDIVFSKALGKMAHDDVTWLIDCPETHDDICAALEGRNMFVHSSLGFRKSAFADIGFYDEKWLRAQDYEFYLRALRAGKKFGAVKEPLITRVYSPNAITVINRKNQIMYSFAAQVLHAAHKNQLVYMLNTILKYTIILCLPNSIRRAKRLFSRVLKKGT